MSTNKKIELYGDGIGAVEYMSHMGTDLTVVNAARVSFGKHCNLLDPQDEKLINYLIKHKHTSTLEHNVVTFRFKVPLYVRSQHHRHRTWSYNEISRRYTEENLEFYVPQMYRTQHKSNRQASNQEELINPHIPEKELNYLGDDAVISAHVGMHNPYMCMMELNEHHHQWCLYLYNFMMEKGVCREQARGVLPQNLYTEYYGTVNLNNLMKFISLRTHEGAQWEIQKVAEACLEIARDLWPVTVEAYERNKK